MGENTRLVVMSTKMFNEVCEENESLTARLDRAEEVLRRIGLFVSEKHGPALANKYFADEDELERFGAPTSIRAKMDGE